MDGAYCLFCRLFSSQTAGKGNHVNIKSLVSHPFSRWKDAKEHFNHHQTTIYHKNATVSAQNFIDVQEKKISDISLQLDTAKKNEIELNRKILSSIVETIILIGRQEMAYRGHRYSGPTSLETIKYLPPKSPKSQILRKFC